MGIGSTKAEALSEIAAPHGEVLRERSPMGNGTDVYSAVKIRVHTFVYAHPSHIHIYLHFSLSLYLSVSLSVRMIYCSLLFISMIHDSGFKELVHLFLSALNRNLLDIQWIQAQLLWKGEHSRCNLLV